MAPRRQRPSLSARNFSLLGNLAILVVAVSTASSSWTALAPCSDHTPLPVPSRTWHVGPQGADTPACGSAAGASACRTLAAVLHRPAHDINGTSIAIEATPGLAYACPQIELNVSVQLLGVGAEAPVFDCSGKGPLVSVRRGAAYFVAQHLQVRRCTSHGDGGCLRILDTPFVALQNLSISHATCSGSGGGIAVAYANHTRDSCVVLSSLSFSNTTAHAGSGGAVDVRFGDAASGVTVHLSGSVHVANSTASAHGGAVHVGFEGSASNSSILVAGFVQASGAHAAAGGGGVLAVRTGTSTSNMRIGVAANVSITNASATQGHGGVLAVSLGGPAYAVGVDMELSGSMELVRAGDSGGAVSIRFRGNASATSVSVGGNLRISDTRAGGAESSVGAGGAFALFYEGPASKSAVHFNGAIVTSDTTALGGQGGMLALWYLDILQDAVLDFNGYISVSRATAASDGGALSVIAQDVTRNFSIAFVGRVRTEDTAARSGDGGALSLQFFGSAVQELTVALAGNFSVRNAFATGNGGAYGIHFWGTATGVHATVGGRHVIANATAVQSGGMLAVQADDIASEVHVLQTGTVYARHSAAGGFNGNFPPPLWQSSASGGVISLYFAKSLSSSSVVFNGSLDAEHCFAHGNGAVLSLQVQGTAASSGTWFNGALRAVDVHTRRGHGGALHVLFDTDCFMCTVALTGTLAVTNASAFANGGAVYVALQYVASQARIQVAGTGAFDEVTALGSGGAMHLELAYNASDCVLGVAGQQAFHNVQAGGPGGAIFAAFAGEAWRSSIRIEGNVTGSGGSAFEGGLVAIAMTGNVYDSSVVVYGVHRLDGGSAVRGGGCMLVRLASAAARNASVHIGGGLALSNCVSSASGGALLVSLEEATQSSLLFVYVTSVTIRNSRASSAAAIGGAVRAVCARDVPNVTGGGILGPSVPLWDSPCSLVLDSVYVYNGSAGYGGGVSVANGLVSLYNVSLVNCTAGNAGGALHIDGTANATVAGFLVSGASSDSGQGSAVYSISPAVTSIANATITSVMRSASVVFINAATEASVAADVSVRCAAGAVASASTATVPTTMTPWSAYGSCCQLQSLQLLCAECDRGTYSLATATFRGTLIDSQAVCQEQPYGAIANGGADVVARPRFWGWITTRNIRSPIQARRSTELRQDLLPRTAQPPGARFQRIPSGRRKDVAELTQAAPIPEGTSRARWAVAHGSQTGAQTRASAEVAVQIIVMAECPAGYCCPGPDACAPFDACAPYREGVLCGTCAQGSSLAYGSSSCIPDAKCRAQSTAWLIVGSCLLAVAVAVWYLAARSSASDGTGLVLVGFYQLLPLLLIGATTRALGQDILSSLFSLRIPSGRGGTAFCLPSGITPQARAGIHVAIPIASLLCVALWQLVGTVLRRTSARFASIQIAWRPAVLGILMLAYTTVSTTVFSLLHCVSAAGDKRLFMNGSVACYSAWQLALVPLAAVLVAAPVALGRWLYVIDRTKSHHWSAAAASLMNPFRSRHRFWSAVLLGRRLVVTAVASLSSDILEQAVVNAVASVTALCIQIAYRPFKHSATNALEVFSLAILSLVSMFAVRSASYRAAGLVPQGPVADATQHIDLAVALLALCPAACVAAVQALRWWLARPTSPAERERSHRSGRELESLHDPLL